LKGYLHHQKNHSKQQTNARLQLPQHAGTPADDENAADRAPVADIAVGRPGSPTAWLGGSPVVIHDTSDGGTDVAINGRAGATGRLVVASDVAASGTADSGAADVGTATAGSADVAVTEFLGPVVYSDAADDGSVLAESRSPQHLSASYVANLGWRCRTAGGPSLASSGQGGWQGPSETGGTLGGSRA
jgi:hypothetical protein